LRIFFVDYAFLSEAEIRIGRENFMKKIYWPWLTIALVFLMTRTAYCDEATDWNRYLLESLRATNASAQAATRSAAIVHVAVADAVNGIDRRYNSIRVQPDAARSASRRAAAVQAAYAVMVRLFPTRQVILNAQRQISLDRITHDHSDPQVGSIQAGIEWGQKVADAIWEWRSTDGLSISLPPFLGGSAPGQWRPTPPDSSPGAAVQFATMTPWVIPSPSYFRPDAPPALNSDRYTADFNEVNTKGSATGARTAEQTLSVFFWASTTPTYLWNTAATTLAARRRTSLSENARLLAVLNLAMADATIGCWDAKYVYEFWRPLTAITLADDDGNPATLADSTWAPLIPTPAHPEYPSGHSCNSAAGAAVLARYFGDYNRLTLKSEVMFGISRSFHSFSAALEDVKDARVFGGIHFRSACEAGQKLGIQIANYVMQHFLLP
jgi:PAP2 superfamily